MKTTYFIFVAPMNYTIKKLSTIEEMLPSLDLIHDLTPDVTPEQYNKMLHEMVPHNYWQVAMYDGDQLIAISGYWICTKVYSGKYLEIDNFVVHRAYRSKNLGASLVKWMEEEARQNGCKTILLDAYVENFKAHKFYYSRGFIARGFHYLKRL